MFLMKPHSVLAIGTDCEVGAGRWSVESNSTGVFPDALKISKVITIFKKGYDTEPSSYSPISLIPVFAKIFETVIKNQICEYFESSNMFSNSQYGFRSNSNTTKAVISFIGYILDALEDHRFSSLHVVL
ncbi:hypothetical protein ANN_18987 [Periplaneta americana]|uniref:Reverse transcriptase domain-containing protein n=1 Tax=Periplaneta americana TaxID=6978 RepID=A0ABQ8SRK7_PERAM|nr:hypothetical protein ANN_18987 [Periplaneta americana]